MGVGDSRVAGREALGTVERPRVPFHRKLGSFIFVAFAFELGVFLLVFPWLGNWDRASIPGLTAWLGTYWSSSYLRGAISGLGALDLYVSLSEFVKLRRSWGAGRENESIAP